MAEEHNQSTEKCRADFKIGVRRALAAAAGNRCSMPRCLQETAMAVTAKKKGVLTAEKRPGGIGVAAHIYGASKTNCPRPSELDDAALSNFSNGIWCCSNCGRLIDEHEEAFTADALIAYKYVRETANSVASKSPIISKLLPSITHLEYEEIVWKYYPDIEKNTPKIEADVRNSESIKKFHKPFYFPSILTTPTPSAPFVKAGLTAATEILTVQLVHPSKLKPKPGDQKTIECIAKNWYPRWDLKPNIRNKVSLGEFYGAITAICPKTGELADERVKVYGHGVVAIDTGDNIESGNRYGFACWLRGRDELPISWTLNYNLKGDVSEIKQQGQRLTSLYWTDSIVENLKQYESLTKKLIGGWAPVGLLGFWTDFKGDSFHDDYFPIVKMPSESGLREMHRRARRTNLIIEMSSIYQLPLKISDAVFCTDLSDEAIEQACLDLKNVSANGVPSRYRSEPCATGDGWDIRLVFETGFNRFALYFKKTILT